MFWKEEWMATHMSDYLYLLNGARLMFWKEEWMATYMSDYLYLLNGARLMEGRMDGYTHE